MNAKEQYVLQMQADTGFCNDPICLCNWSFYDGQIIFHRGTPVLFHDEYNDLTESTDE